jgi:hypothetical protein
MQPNELMMKEVEIFVERDGEGFYRVKQYRSATQPVAAPAPAPAPAAETSAAFPDDDIPF